MSILIYGIGLICIAFFIHLLVWKVYLPKNHIKICIYIFFGVLIGGILTFWKLSDYIKIFGITAPRTLPEYLQISFLFTSLTLAYIVTYSAIEVDSPSLVMILNIARANLKGVDKDEFEQKMAQDALIGDRISDLLTGGFINFDGQVYKLRTKGILIARIFIAYRKFLRASKGG